MDIPFMTTFARQYHAERLLVNTLCGLYELFDARCVQYDEERDSTWIITFIMVSVADRDRWLTLRVHFSVPFETTFPKYPGATFLRIPTQELVMHVDCKLSAFKRDANIDDVLRAFGVISKRSVAASPWMSQSSVDRLASVLRYSLQKVGFSASGRIPDHEVAECIRRGICVIQTCGSSSAQATLPGDHKHPSGGYHEVADRS